MKKKNNCIGMLSISVAAILLAARTDSARAESYTDLTDDEKASFEQDVRSSLRSIFFGDVHMDGVVVDADSNLLAGVTVQAKSSSGHDKPWSTNVSGRFSFDFTNRAELLLEFSKDAHYSQWYRFFMGVDTPDLPDGRRGYSNCNVRVVLDAWGGGITPLSEDTRGVEFVLDGISRGMFVGTNASIGGLLVARDGMYATIADHVVYLKVTTNEIGICITNLPSVRYLDGRTFTNRCNFASDLTLVVSGPNDGFYPLSLDVSQMEDWQILQKMKDAPPSGYTNRIHWEPGISWQYFYFYIGGYYGKAKANQDASTNSVEVGINLWLQTNGTRNVRSIEWRQ